MTTKAIAIFTGAGFASLISLVTVAAVFGSKGLDFTVSQCNKGLRGACIDLLKYESKWDQVTSEYGQALIEHHYRTVLSAK